MWRLMCLHGGTYVGPVFVTEAHAWQWFDDNTELFTLMGVEVTEL